MNHFTYLTNEEYQDLTTAQQRERTHLRWQILDDKTYEEKNEFFKNLISERLKTMTTAEKQKMAEVAMAEWKAMAEEEKRKKEAAMKKWGDFNSWWTGEFELIFNTNEFDLLWDSYWEKMRKENEEKIARKKEIESKLSELKI